MYTPTEVTDLELAIHPEKQVFRLDISMDDMLSMEIG
jgi:hypothetical protein